MIRGIASLIEGHWEPPAARNQVRRVKSKAAQLGHLIFCCLVSGFGLRWFVSPGVEDPPTPHLPG